MARFVYQYSLQFLPRVLLTITLVFTPINETNIVSDVSISPISTVFLPSSQSFSGIFIISGTSYSSGLYSLSLNITGYDAPYYNSPQSLVKIIPTAFPLSSPNIASIRFSENIASVYIYFDKETNQAGMIWNNFICSKILNFINSDSSSCTWVNSSSIQIKFGVVLPSLNYIEPGSNITIISNNLQAKCIPGTICSKNMNASQLIGFVQGPYNPIYPNIVLSVPNIISSCSNLSIDISSSSGSGGRPWKSMNWTVIGSDNSTMTNIQSFLLKNSNSKTIITIPSSLLSISSSYTITLPLR